MISSALLLGHSAPITQVREQLRRLVERQSGTRRPVPVLIEGETGSGKGLVARALHREGPRARYPFVDVNCAAIPETLLEAELFGYERGAFTDARQAKPGLFQAAHRGVIFLDEIGLLPDALQSKLLKILEEREVRRLGSTRVEAVDAWVLAATSEDLRAAVRERRFRGDLYHRLAVVTVRLPPLRDRGDDVLMLAEHFLAQACREHGIPKRSLTPDAHAALLAHDWPGNVRELINVMERVALMADESLIGARGLGLGRLASDPGRDLASPGRAPLRDALRELARSRVLEALDAVGWNITHAASRLGVPRGTLRYWMRRYELRPALAFPPPGQASSRRRRPRTMRARRDLRRPACGGSHGT